MIKLGAVLFFGFLITSCSAVSDPSFFDNSSNSAAALACAEDLKLAYEAGLWKLMREKSGTSCSECHSQNGILSSFPMADPNLDIAFGTFHTPTLAGAHIDKVTTRMTNGHQGAGDLSAIDVDAAVSAYVDQIPAFKACLESSKQPDTGGPSDDFKPPLVTANQSLSSSGTNSLDWNLGDEFGANSNGIGFRLQVTRRTINGERNYVVSLPQVIATRSDVEIKYIYVFINNVSVAKQTWSKVHRKFKQGTAATVASSEVLLPVESYSTSDQVKIGFELANQTTFNPPTFSELISSNGFFGKNCLECHSGSRVESGLDLTRYSNLIISGMIVPGDLQASEIYLRINDSQKPMPASGLLSKAKRDQIEDWILDGAPNN